MSGRGIQKALGLPNKSGTELSALFKILKLSSDIPAELEKSINTVYSFKRDGAGGSQLATYGNVAGTLIRICMFLRDNKSIIPEKNQFISDTARNIIDAFAIEGVESAVFRITGYDKLRDELVLGRLLDKNISPEKREYEKRFPMWYYENIYRLKGWDFEPIRNRTIKNTNSQLGTITMNVVWDRQLPGLKKRLEELNNQRTKSGSLTHYHHQHLTDSGLKMLKEHFSLLEVLLQISKSWEDFMYNLDILRPVQGTIQQKLGFEEKLRLQ